MVSTLHTPRTTRELITDIHNLTERMHDSFASKRRGDVSKVREIQAQIGELTLLTSRLSFKFLHEVYEDGLSVAYDKRSIEQLKDILDEFKKEKKQAVREKRFLRRFANNTKKLIEKESKKVIKQAEIKSREEAKKKQ